MKYYLAVDIGATSGRHILGCIKDGQIVMEEAFRFDTHFSKQNEQWAWQPEDLVEKVLKGIKECAAIGKTPKSIGIDAWGADYVLTDSAGNVVCSAADYRDEMGMISMLFESEGMIPGTEYYEITGIGKMPIDTVYQLMTLKKQHPEILERGKRLMMLPSYINYKLTGTAMEEYSNAVTTGLMNAQARDWDMDVISRLGLPGNIFGELHEPGKSIGRLCEKAREFTGCDCDVVLVPSHDTTSAFFAVDSDNGATVSSGTWSILGVVNSEPVKTPEAMAAGLSNESAYPDRYRLSKNIIGMYVLEKIRESIGVADYDELIRMARAAGEIESVMDLSNLMYLLAEDMPTAIREECAETGQQIPETDGEVLRVFFHSLAVYYAKTVHDIEGILSKKLDHLKIIGGGSRNDYMNELAAKELGIPVLAGPNEAAVLGNLISQMLMGGEFRSIDEAKAAVKKSFPAKRFDI